MHRAVDEEAGTIGALDLPFMAEFEIDPGMVERPAIAGSDRLINVDGFERPHMRPGYTSQLERPADGLTRR